MQFSTKKGGKFIVEKCQTGGGGGGRGGFGKRPDFFRILICAPFPNLLVIIKSILRIDMYIHNCVPTNWTKGWPHMFVKHYGETLDVYFFKMEYGIFAPCMAK